MSLVPPIDPSTGNPYVISPFGPLELEEIYFNGQYTKINGKVYKIERPTDEEVMQYERLQKLKRIIK